MSYREIGKSLKKNFKLPKTPDRSNLCRVYKHWRTHQSIHRKKRECDGPYKLKSPLKRKIKNLVSKSNGQASLGCSIRTIARNLNHEVSQVTIANHFKQNNMRPWRPQTVPNEGVDTFDRRHHFTQELLKDKKNRQHN